MADEVGSHLPQPVILASRPTVFDDDVLTLNVARVIQAPMKRGHELCEGTGRLAVEESNHRCRRLLLRLRRERPRGRYAAKQHDQVAAPHGAYPQGQRSRTSIASFECQW